MADIESQLGINRESLVALALLLGCDYCPKGVPGVGRETATKFVQYMEGESILKRCSIIVFGPLNLLLLTYYPDRLALFFHLLSDLFTIQTDRYNLKAYMPSTSQYLL